MTTMPQDLRTLILGTTTVSGLVGTRCHYNHLPESSAYPHIWFRTASDNEELTLDGVGGLHEAQIDIECVASTEDSAQAVADVLKPRLHGFKGAMGNVTAQGIFLRDKDDDYVPFSNQSDEGAHVVAFGAAVWYST